MADVVQGVEWAVESHIKKAKKGGKGFKGSVANMSLGGGKSKTLEDAVNAGVEAGVHFAVAAGNDNADACSYSPAAAEKAVTVGASTLGDERAYFSNYGKCTDIFAPGLNILSTWIGSKHAVNTISGTSMASPHIAGLLAYFVSLQPSKESAFAVELTPEKLKKDIISIATEGILTDIPADTPNVCISPSNVIRTGLTYLASFLPGTAVAPLTTATSSPVVATRPMLTLSPSLSSRPAEFLRRPCRAFGMIKLDRDVLSYVSRVHWLIYFDCLRNRCSGSGCYLWSLDSTSHMELIE
jgi:subtilisin family serine protease